MLGDGPAPDHGRDGAHRQDAGSPLRAASKQDQYPDPADDRDHHERQPVALEAVEDVACISMQRDQTDNGERARDHGRNQRAPGEVALEVGRAGAARVADEEHARQVRAGGHEEGAGHEREQVDPAAHPVACRIADRHAAARDRADDRSQEERGQHRRRAEHGRGKGSAACAARGVLEREAGSSQDDPERSQAQRDEQRREDGLEGGREAGPQDHEHEDQPHVVRLPHRPDCPVDQRARPPAAFPSTGEQAPETRPEVGAAEDRVHRYADDEDDGDGVREGHCELPVASGGAPVSGPYGTSSSPSSSRQRRDIARRVMISVAPSAI